MANEYRVNATHAEVVAAFNPDARINAIHAEVVASFNPDARINAIFVEVVRSIAEVPASTGRRRQALLGSL